MTTAGRWWLALGISVLAAAPAAHSKAPPASPVLSNYRVLPRDGRALWEIARRFEIVARDGRVVDVIVPAHRVAELRAHASSLELLDADLTRTVREQLRRHAQDSSFAPGYRSFEQVQELLEQVAQRYQPVARLMTYGTSAGGRPLRALKISDNAQEDEDEPEILLTAATHGDELITVEVLLELLRELLEGAETQERFRQMIARHEIFFVPVVNADGFAGQQRYDGSRDPNRSYPWPEKPDNRPTPSIDALLKFFHSRQFVASIDFHAYGEMIMYPWAWTHEPIPSEPGRFLDALTASMASTNGYAHGPISKVIYIAKGSSADYYFWKKGTAAIAIEVGRSKVPSPKEIPRYVRENAEATWRFIESF